MRESKTQDGSLSIQSKSPCLSRMLSASGECLEGVHFPDLLVEAEQDIGVFVRLKSTSTAREGLEDVEAFRLRSVACLIRNVQERRRFREFIKAAKSVAPEQEGAPPCLRVSLQGREKLPPVGVDLFHVSWNCHLGNILFCSGWGAWVLLACRMSHAALTPGCKVGSWPSTLHTQARTARYITVYR